MAKSLPCLLVSRPRLQHISYSLRNFLDLTWTPGTVSSLFILALPTLMKTIDVGRDAQGKLRGSAEARTASTSLSTFATSGAALKQEPHYSLHLYGRRLMDRLPCRHRSVQDFKHEILGNYCDVMTRIYSPTILPFTFSTDLAICSPRDRKSAPVMFSVSSANHRFAYSLCSDG